VLIIGGGDAAKHFREVWLMTNNAGRVSFKALPPLPVPLAQMTGALVGRHVHVVGGIERPDATSALSTHWRLDLDATAKGWQEMPALPAAGRILATAAAIGGALYVAGGCSLTADAAGKPARTYLRDVWRFAGGTWTRVADLPRAAAAAASPAPVAGDNVFVVSGDDGTQTTLASPANHPGFPREILRYSAGEDRWYRAGDLTVQPPVTLPAVPWQNDFIFFSGEVRPGIRTPQVFRFHPGI